MAATPIRISLILIVLFLPFLVKGQQSVLKKKINVSAEQQPLEDVLLTVAENAGFSFSYNADLIPVDSLISIESENEPVKSVLNTLLGENLEYKFSGNLLVILRTKYDEEPIASLNKKTFTIDGFLQNAETGEYITGTTVYDVGGLRSTVTDETGYFSLEIPFKEQNVAISVSSEAFDQKAIVLPSKIRT